MIQAHGLSLGIREGPIYGKSVVGLREEVLVLIYIDGTKETRGITGQRIWIWRLNTVIKQHLMKSSNELLNLLLSELTFILLANQHVIALNCCSSNAFR